MWSSRLSAVTATRFWSRLKSVTWTVKLFCSYYGECHMCWKKWVRPVEDKFSPTEKLCSRNQWERSENFSGFLSLDYIQETAVGKWNSSLGRILIFRKKEKKSSQLFGKSKCSWPIHVETWHLVNVTPCWLRAGHPLIFKTLALRAPSYWTLLSLDWNQWFLRLKNQKYEKFWYCSSMLQLGKSTPHGKSWRYFYHRQNDNTVVTTLHSVPPMCQVPNSDNTARWVLWLFIQVGKLCNLVQSLMNSDLSTRFLWCKSSVPPLCPPALHWRQRTLGTQDHISPPFCVGVEQLVWFCYWNMARVELGHV